MTLVAFDLFCGCGGVTSGLRRAGIRVDLGIDWDENCRLTYTLNNPGAKFIRGDIREMSGAELLRCADNLRPDDYLLIAACAPCQPFSSQNRGSGNKQLRTMVGEVERLVRELEPDFVFAENVPGIQAVKGFSAFRRLLSTLETLGYKHEFCNVDAQFYGVPQSRKRLVLLASRYAALAWPAVRFGNESGLSTLRTVRDAIGHFPSIAAGESHPTIPNHVAAQLSVQNLARLLVTPKDGGSRKDWPDALGLKCHKNHDGHPDVYGRLKWDAPAPTLTTKCTSISNGRYGHPEQDRAISVREAASLQGFPDDYVFYGGLKTSSRLVGNAVPPLLAFRFGSVFVRATKKMGGVIKDAQWRRLIRQRNRPAIRGTVQVTLAHYREPSSRLH